jgi:hypothetical protein
MNFRREIRSLYILTAACICAIVAILLGGLLAPRLARDQASDETIILDAGGPRTNANPNVVNPPPKGGVKTVPTLQPDNNDDAFCIQVITPARNPATGEIRDFPTPCDVPEGWIPVSNINNPQ